MSENNCLICSTLNFFHNGPDLYASSMLSKHVNLHEKNGKWFLMIADHPYPVKYCPYCGRKLDKNTKFEVTNSL